MTAMNEDSATVGTGGITRSVKDYCNQAVVNFKAGRFKEAYLFANEAMELDEKDAKAAAIHRHVLYALHPKKRLLDKSKSLHEEADRCMKAGDHDKAFELISLAKMWHCTPGVLYTCSKLRSRSDLSYVDEAEGLARSKKDRLSFVIGQRVSLSRLGYKVLPELEPEPVPGHNEMPARYHVNKWPEGLQISNVYLREEHAEAIKFDGTLLKPQIPLDQLAQFLNHHVQDTLQGLSFVCCPQGMVPQLLDEVTVPGRLHVDILSFTNFFHLPWASIERILDGRTLRANTTRFSYLQLPTGVDANKLLKLPTVRECTRLLLSLYTRNNPQPHGRPPLFNNAALLEWIKWSGDRSLLLTREHLSSGLLSFLDALKKDFRQTTQVHSYNVTIFCPHIDVIAGLGVQHEELSNRLGEEMVIVVGEERTATLLMGHRFETVSVVRRLPPS